MKSLSHKIICGNSAIVLPKFKKNSIDLIVTSPPYDHLRSSKTYKAEFNFEQIAQELYRTLKPGGIIVWVIGDATINGSETGTSFRQALYFKEIGFNLHDTMIYEKNRSPFPEHTRYYNIFEFMFIFSKGKPTTINLLKDRKNRWPEGSWGNKTSYSRDGNKVVHEKFQSEEYGVRFNIWRYNVGHGFTTKDEINHPAKFPEKLANDHIRSWSNEEDIILDPFVESGTTSIECERLKRNSIGIDLAQEYCQSTYDRLLKAVKQTQLGYSKSIITKRNF